MFTRDDVLVADDEATLPPEIKVRQDLCADRHLQSVQRARKPLPEATAIERFLLEEDVRWTLQMWHTGRKETYELVFFAELLQINFL